MTIVNAPPGITRMQRIREKTTFPLDEDCARYKGWFLIEQNHEELPGIYQTTRGGLIYLPSIAVWTSGICHHKPSGPRTTWAMFFVPDSPFNASG